MGGLDLGLKGGKQVFLGVYVLGALLHGKTSYEKKNSEDGPSLITGLFDCILLKNIPKVVFVCFP